MHFMAIEVECQGYLFLPDSYLPPKSDTSSLPNVTTIDISPSVPLPPFRMNAFHDLESLWWAVTWVLFRHTDKKTPTTRAQAQLDFFNQAFPGKIGQVSRQQFFIQSQILTSAYDTLSTTYGEKSDMFWRLATLFKYWYRRVEREHSCLPLRGDHLMAMHEQVSLAFYTVLTNLDGSCIQLLPLHDLPRPEKRNVDDSPCSPTRKRAK